MSSRSSCCTKRQQTKAVSAFAVQALRPLFVPLYTKWFEAFRTGKKTVEHRTYGPGWNERTCPVGRAVTLSHGYGKYARLSARITKFRHVGTEAHIHLSVDLPA